MSKAAVLKLRAELKHELQIINTMDILKQIAVSEFHYLDRERREASKFLKVLESFFYFFKARGLKHSLFFKTPCRAPAVVAIGSDEGFLGALNNRIIEKAAEMRGENPAAQVIVLGRRSAAKMRDLGIQPREFPGIPFPLNFDAIAPLKTYLMDEYLGQRIGSAQIVYAKCHSITRQTLEVVRLLPFSISDLGAPGRREGDEGHVIVEPDVKSIVEYAIALWFGRRLYEIFWDSKLSEVATRSIELSERHEALSCDSARTRARYFRASHEVIDAGIREVFASHHFFGNKLREINMEAQGARPQERE